MKNLLLVPMMLLAACGTGPRIPVARVVTVPVRPAVVKVDRAVDEIGRQAASLQRKNDALARSADDANLKAEESARQAEALAQTGKATQEQFDALAHSARLTQKALDTVVTDVREKSALIDKLQKQIADTHLASQSAVGAATVNDVDVKVIQDNFTQLEKDYKGMVKERDHWKSEYDSAKPYQHFIWWVAGIAALYGLIRIFKATTPWGAAIFFWVP